MSSVFRYRRTTVFFGMHERTEMAKEQEFQHDVRRTVLLGAYMGAWGMPSSRTVTRRGEHVVEAYTFPAVDGVPVNRFATVGISGHEMEDGRKADWELFLALPPDNAGASDEEVLSFLFDVMAYSISKVKNFDLGTIIPESPLAPQSWTARALLVDEPRAEPEFLSEIELGPEVVRLRWIVPIYRDEFEVIRTNGLDAFDKAAETSEWSPADPRRPSFLGQGT